MLNKILYGRTKALSLPNGEKRTAQYVIVDLSEIKASHNEVNFQDTEGYPVNEFGRNINDRNYKTDTAAQQTVISIAQNIDADKLIELTSSPSGTPIISKEGIVVSGNNRIMSLKLAASTYPDQYQKYLDTLASEVTSFGFESHVGTALRMHESIPLPGSSYNDPKSARFNHPVLVRIDQDIPALNTTELAKYNLISKKGERSVDKAVKLGNILRENERCRNVILAIVDGYDTFSDLYSPAGRNDRKKLVQAFIDCSLIPEQQMVSFYNDGEFTDQGKDFVESVLSAMILTPDALNVAGQEGVRRLRQIIISSLPVLISNANLPDGASLQPYISEAVVIEYKIRQLGDFSDFIRNQALFAEASFSEKSYYLNRLLNQGRNAFKDAIKKYNDAIRANTGDTLFAGEKLSADQIFQRTIIDLLEERDLQLITQKFSKAKPAEEIKPTHVIEKVSAPGIVKNLWANDGWFQAFPGKVLGLPYEASGRFGTVIKYKGTIEDVKKIEVPDNFIGNMKPITDPLASVDNDRIPELDALDPPMIDKIDSIIGQSKKDTDTKILQKEKKKRKQKEPAAVKKVGELQTFEEIYAKYNDQINKDELEAFIWWKTHTKKPLSGRWVNLVHPGKYQVGSYEYYNKVEYNVSKETIAYWVKEGIIFYNNGQYEPEAIYVSGDVYDKKFQLSRDRDRIVELYGQKVFDNQSDVFSRSFKKKYDSRLTITGQTDNGLVLIPTSKFAEGFTVERLQIMADDQNFMVKSSSKAEGKPDFVKDPETTESKRDIFYQLSLKDAFAFWLQRGSPEIREAISTMDIIRYYLLGSHMMNKFEQGTPQYEIQKVKNEKTKAACQKEGERLFLFFLNDQLLPNDKVRLETEWNSQFNNYLPVDYNKIPIAFTMCKYYKGKEEHLRPEKREAVAFSMIEGSACLSYDVGVGKTPSAIFTISAFIDAGFCKRPFICVPNQVYRQFIAEIKDFAPHIPVLEAYNLGEEYVKNFQDTNGKISQVPAGTITVITYEGLEQIGFSDTTYSELFSELYTILNQGGEAERKKTKRQAEGFQAKLESILGKGLRGTLFNIEDFGFDFGCYDEAHKMKKVFTAVKGEEEADGSRGRNPYVINSGTPSAIGLKGFMLNYYIQRNNDWQNVLLLTATPFTNSPLEIFSMLSMVAYNKLKETDLNSLKSFFDTYVSTSNELVINSRLKPQFKQVILGFNNLVSLQSLIRRFINYKTGEQVNVQRPNKYVLPYVRKIEDGVVIDLPENERVETYIQMTPAQKVMQEDIIAYVEGKISLSELKVSVSAGQLPDADDDENEDKTEGVEVDFDALSDKEKQGVKTIRGLSFSRNLALSPYLYEYSGMKNPTYKEYIETSPKLRYVIECIRSIKQYHESRNEPVSGQVIYMDRGVEYFSLIKEYLVQQLGYKDHEIGIIKSGLPKTGKKSKDYIKNLFNGEIYNEHTKLFEQVPDDQRIKVVIGSGAIKEGMNLQRYSSCLHNCFLDWNPTDIQQLDGRIWRQGNTFAAIRINNPLLIDSADIFMFQKLQEKTSRLNSIWATDGRSNVLNTEEFNPEELKYALIRDAHVIAELRSIEEASKVAGDIIGNERLIENGNHVKEIINQINNLFEQVLKQYQQYRDFRRTDNKLTDAERLVEAVIELDKTQIGRNGAEIQYDKPYYFGDFALAVRDLKKLYTTFLNPFKIKVTLHDLTPIDNFIKKTQDKITELNAFQEKVRGKEYQANLYEQIEQERIQKKVTYKTLDQVVAAFDSMNFLLNEKKVPAMAKVISMGCPPMKEGERLIDEESLAHLEECVMKLPETKDLHTDADSNKYTPARVALHRQIIDDMFKNVHCIGNHEPLAIFTGGAPGSGKSTYLKKIPWLMDNDGRINPSIFHIDADDIRAKLPEYKGWNATITHKETQDITSELLEVMTEVNCKYDFIYDGTMNRAEKYFPLINRAKQMGYKTFIIFMDVPYSVSRERTLQRYKKRGRYVPLEVIDDFFTQIPAVNKTKGQYALDQLKDVVDGYIVVNGVTGEVIERKGENLPKQRYYKKEPVELVEKSEEVIKKREQVKPKPAGKQEETKVIEKEKRPAPIVNKKSLQRQIQGLEAALEFADATQKEKLKLQIEGLTEAIKYAA